MGRRREDKARLPAQRDEDLVRTTLKVFRREFSGNFYSWRGGIWLIVSSVIFSTIAYLLLTDKELSLLDQGESLYLLSEVIVALAMIMSAASASSLLSGEMEAGTFESLLLTPITPRRIAAEKLLSVVFVWILMYAVSVPYLVVVASGTNLALPAVAYVGLFGTLLVIAVSAVCISISGRLHSKSGIMASLMITLGLLAPSLFFATSLKKTDFGLALESLNPASHAINSLDSVLVDNETALWQQTVHLLPVIGFVVLCIILFVVYSRHFEVKGSE
jgi:ABC-2 type transport system permease protein